MKRTLSLVAYILFVVKCLAQFTPFSGGGDTTFSLSAYADVNCNYTTYANNVSGLLEASRVPAGFLLDHGFDFTEPKTFNGIVIKGFEAFKCSDPCRITEPS